MALTEKRLGEILEDKFEAQKEWLKAKFEPLQEAKEQVWKNKDQILIIQTEKKTIRWGLAAIYSLIAIISGAITSIITILTTLDLLSKP